MRRDAEALKRNGYLGASEALALLEEAVLDTAEVITDVEGEPA